MNYHARALEVVAGQTEIPAEELYIVWFCKTLQNWKALVSTDVDVFGGAAQNHPYWEVTHNGDKGETYVDTYSKVSNVAVPDAQR